MNEQELKSYNQGRADLKREMMERLPKEKKIKHFSKEDDGRSFEVLAMGGHKCNFNCKPDIDEVGYNQALSEIKHTLEEI